MKNIVGALSFFSSTFLLILTSRFIFYVEFGYFHFLLWPLTKRSLVRVWPAIRTNVSSCLVDLTSRLILTFPIFPTFFLFLHLYSFVSSLNVLRIARKMRNHIKKKKKNIRKMFVFLKIKNRKLENVSVDRGLMRAEVAWRSQHPSWTWLGPGTWKRWRGSWWRSTVVTIRWAWMPRGLSDNWTPAFRTPLCTRWRTDRRSRKRWVS